MTNLNHEGMRMKCSKCQKQLISGERVIEILNGSLKAAHPQYPKLNLSLEDSETLIILCEPCEDKVIPALWANITKQK